MSMWIAAGSGCTHEWTRGCKPQHQLLAARPKPGESVALQPSVTPRACSCCWLGQAWVGVHVCSETMQVAEQMVRLAVAQSCLSNCSVCTRVVSGKSVFSAVMHTKLTVHTNKSGRKLVMVGGASEVHRWLSVSHMRFGTSDEHSCSGLVVFGACEEGTVCSDATLLTFAALPFSLQAQHFFKASHLRQQQQGACSFGPVHSSHSTSTAPHPAHMAWHQRLRAQ